MVSGDSAPLALPEAAAWCWWVAARLFWWRARIAARQAACTRTAPGLAAAGGPALLAVRRALLYGKRAAASRRPRRTPKRAASEAPAGDVSKLLRTAATGTTRRPAFLVDCSGVRSRRGSKRRDAEGLHRSRSRSHRRGLPRSCPVREAWMRVPGRTRVAEGCSKHKRCSQRGCPEEPCRIFS